MQAVSGVQWQGEISPPAPLRVGGRQWDKCSGQVPTKLALPLGGHASSMCTCRPCGHRSRRCWGPVRRADLPWEKCYSSPRQTPLAFFPKPISPDVVCVSVPQAQSNYSFRVALFLAKTDHLPRNEKCTKPCNLLTSVTSVRNYQHKTNIFFLDLFYSNTYLCLFAKVSFIAIATMFLNIFLTGNLSCF